jgi:4-carboxymuconolactone decarboxylase
MIRMALVEKIPDEALDPTLQTNLGRALYNNPGLCIPFKALASSTHLKSHLEPRLRELVVLRISAALKSDVEWGQHFRIATTAAVYGKVSVTVAEARDVRDGNLAGFPLKERIAMEFGIAVDKNAVDDKAWALISEHFTPIEVLDLTVLAGVYGLAGRLTNALAVPMDEGILPISAVDSLA